MTYDKVLYNKSRSYKLTLGIAIFILILIFVVITSLILELQRSGTSIADNISETRSLNKLIYNLKDVESKYYSLELNKTYLDSIEKINEALIKTLDNTYASFNSFKENHDVLYSKLNLYVSTEESDLARDDFVRLFEKGASVKQQLLQEHEDIINSEIKHFETNNRIKPLIFIAASLGAMLVIILVLYYLFDAKKAFDKKTNILDSILENTKDVTNFYEPVYNENRKVVDFKITHASKTNILQTDQPYTEINGKLVSEVYPFLKKSGLFHQLVTAFEKHELFEKELEIPINGETRHFRARYIPLESGLQVMVTELTQLYANQKHLQKVNEELKLQNYLFKEAESVAKLGSYIWYMRDDVTIMSDNVFRIMGYEPQSFPMSAAKFREFTHPDDLEVYDRVVTDALEHDTPINFEFRVSTNEGIKFLHSEGSFSEHDGKEIMIGVIQDITDRIAYQNSLKEKNIELTRRNVELDSFNRVASHDLQEPLRKIQMFVSRVKDTEHHNLSEKGETYFDKIEKAASRMRDLINNLLAISRIDNKDYEFEMVDLNEVIGYVVDTFPELNANTDINFIIDELPEINAIPFLMEQLFTNLIGNAIKYRSTQRRSKIKLEYSKVHSKQIPHDFIKTHAYYHCIKVIDNGIGFDQKNSSKIFELFHRLHSKNEYKGTGLGLAICEKIVFKHYGFIYANGIAGEGSVFTIYLPSGKLKYLENN